MRFYLFMFVLILCQTSSAQTISNLKVKLLDAQTKEPLIGASIVQGQFGTLTDINGEGQLKLDSDGDVIISYIGYETITLSKKDWMEEVILLFMNEAISLLETAIVTATRYEKPLAESTVSVDIIKPEFFERNAAPSIQEILNRMPGVQIIDNQANIRGGSGWSFGAGSRVMLLLDDMPYLQVDAATTNWSDLPMENVGAIEILKGASSALYGSSALNGVIHFRSNYPKDVPETEFSLQTTIFDMPEDSTDYRISHNTIASILHRRQIGKLDVVASLYYRNEEGYRQETSFKFGRSSVQLRYRFSDRLVFGLNSLIAPAKSRNYFFWDSKESFRGRPGGFTKSKRLRYNLDPYVKWDHGRWTHKIQGRFYDIKNDNINEQDNQSTILYGEYQSQYRNEKLQFNMTGGLMTTYTYSVSQLYSDTSFHNYNNAIFLQADKKIGDKWSLSGGVRWERNELRSPEVIFGDTIPDGKTTESKPIFRFGLNYKAAKATYLRSSWGQGYRFPSIAEKYISTSAGGLDIKPNPSLESEEGWTVELGLRQGFAGHHWNGFMDLSFFRSEYQNMMEFGAAQSLALPFFTSQNVGGVRIDGLEWNGFFTYQHNKWNADLTFGFTYLNPILLDWDENGIGRRPNDTSLTIAEKNAANSTATNDVLKYRNKFNNKWDFQLGYGPWFCGLSVNHTSHMEAIDRVLAAIIPGLMEDDEVLLDPSGYTTIDLRLGWKYKSFKMQMLMKNLTDERYWARPGFLEAPRNYTLRLDYKF